jgi:ABC-2 type transport system permease protein
VAVIENNLAQYFITTLLTMLLGIPVAFFALVGEGYLAPLGFVALTLVFSQIVAAAGYGHYFPWSIPGLYSGAGGLYRGRLDTLSYVIVSSTAIAGYISTVIWWRYSDQKR